MSVDASRFFGQNSAFADACDLYQAKTLPADILEHANTLGRSRIAFALGYAFAVAVRGRNMKITEEELRYVATGKIVSGDPDEFINGFRRFTP